MAIQVYEDKKEVIENIDVGWHQFTITGAERGQKFGNDGILLQVHDYHYNIFIKEIFSKFTQQEFAITNFYKLVGAMKLLGQTSEGVDQYEYDDDPETLIGFKFNALAFPKEKDDGTKQVFIHWAYAPIEGKQGSAEYTKEDVEKIKKSVLFSFNKRGETDLDVSLTSIVHELPENDDNLPF